MEYFTFLVYTILFITITLPVAVVIFDFFDIKFEVYGNYLLWLIALAIFNAILPYKEINIFDIKNLNTIKEKIVSKSKSVPYLVKTGSITPNLKPTKFDKSRKKIGKITSNVLDANYYGNTPVPF